MLPTASPGLIVSDLSSATDILFYYLHIALFKFTSETLFTVTVAAQVTYHYHENDGKLCISTSN